MLLAHLRFDDANGHIDFRLTERTYRFDVDEQGRVVCDVPDGYPARFGIRGSGNRWTIEDETFDWVYVNGLRFRQKLLLDGDKVKIGDKVATFTCVEIDEKTLPDWTAEKARVAQADELAMEASKYHFGDREFPQDYGRAFEVYTEAAGMGSGRAWSGLGAMYQYGEGVPKSVDEAIGCYRRAAECGYARGAEHLASLLEQEGRHVDAFAARKLADKLDPDGAGAHHLDFRANVSAEPGWATFGQLAGPTEEQRLIAECMSYQESRAAVQVLQDGWLDEALRIPAGGLKFGRRSSDWKLSEPGIPGTWFYVVMDSGFWRLHAATSVGVPVNGEVVTRFNLIEGDEIEVGQVCFRFSVTDPRNRIDWNWKRQIKRQPPGQSATSDEWAWWHYWTGMNAYNGVEMRRDDREAFAAFLKAADAGHTSASYRLGEMLMHGRGCERDLEEAEKRLIAAAIEHHPDAQLTLALAYRFGRFFDRNLVRAHAFYSMCDQPFRPEPHWAFSDLILTLSPDELEESVRLVDELEAQAKPLIECGPGE